MAVAPATQPLLKSQPDMSKINAFETGITVTVTKHQAARGTPGSLVFPTQTISKEELMALQVTLPLKHGVGYYAFTAADAGGSGEDSWMVRLGIDPTVPQQQEGYFMAGPGLPGGPAAPMVPSAPLDGDVKQIMPGWFFNEALGLLSTPWRETIPWRQGEALPKPPTGASHLSAIPPTATPWNWPPQQGGWGGYPVTGSSSEIDALKAELAESKRQAELAEVRAEQRRRDDERERREAERLAEDRRREEDRTRREEQRREEDRRREEARTKEMAELIAKLTTKSGPSEHEQRLEREMVEERRRREDSEREATRREEDRRREEQHRTEMREMTERFERGLKEAAANKVDPVMTVFKEVLISQQASAASAMQTMREASAATAAVAERNAITPQQVMEMVRTTRDGASESSKTVMETMRGLMKTQQEVMTSMIEIAGQGQQPWYAGALQEGLNKVGTIGTAMMERNAQVAAQQEQQQQRLQAQMAAARARAAAAAPIVTPAPPPAAPQLRPAGPARAVAPTPPPPSPTPGLAGRAQHTGGRPEGTTYDKKRDLFILADGREVANSVVQENGWGPVLAMSPHDEGAPKLPAGAAPTIVPAAAPPTHVNGSGKKPRGRRAAPPPAPAPLQPDEVIPPAPPPPANGQGYTLDELREMEPDQIRQVVSPMDDLFLFGALMPSIVDLRGRVAKGMPAQKAAEAVLGSRQYLSSFGGQIPPAFELLIAEHFEVLVERLLPDATEHYREAVAAKLEEAIEAERGGGDEEEEEEETAQ